MKYLILLLVLISTNTFAVDGIYLKVGTGYKFHEPSTAIIKGNTYEMDYGDPWSARIELVVEYDDHINFGISHHSQWADGFPFNNNPEYYKTELFIDYKFKIK